MPYVRRYFSQQEQDSSLEPSVKKSKLDYTELCKKNGEEFIPLDAEPQRWGSSGLSQSRYYGSDAGERKKPRVAEHFQNDCDQLKPGSSKHYTESPSSRREDDNKNQQVPDLPKTDNWKPKNCDAAFSETSTSFIGPLYQPPPQVHSRPNHNDSSQPPSFKISTVELGKATNKTKRGDGIDYELLQFYKELHELEETTDDHNGGQTGADSEQHPTHHYHPSNAPAIQQDRNHHCQTPSSPPCNPFPNKPSAPIPPTSHHTEAHIFPAEHRAPPPINKLDSCDGPLPLDRTIPSFVNHSLPPPGFQGLLPPSFPVHHGPPPPRYNYPMTLPRQNNIPNTPYHDSENYQRVNDNHLRPPTQFPCNNPYLPPENWFSTQGRCHTEPFPKPPLVFSQQTYEREDFNGQSSRHFGHITPTGDNVHHEQYPPRFRDNPIPHMEFKRKLVLLRGVPGSGKSTLARFLLDRTPDGIVFSTDDYFCQDSGYAYDVKLLGDAHNWNQKRAKRAMDDGRSPIIIDNTNIQGWEMKPYVQMAMDRGYDVEFLEPNTWWKLDAQELEKRNTHSVPREKISQMLDRFEHDMNVAVVMNSVEPRRGRPSRPPAEDSQRWGASVDDYTQHSKSFQIR